MSEATGLSVGEQLAAKCADLAAMQPGAAVRLINRLAAFAAATQVEVQTCWLHGRLDGDDDGSDCRRRDGCEHDLRDLADEVVEDAIDRMPPRFRQVARRARLQFTRLLNLHRQVPRNRLSAKRLIEAERAAVRA